MPDIVPEIDLISLLTDPSLKREYVIKHCRVFRVLKSQGKYARKLKRAV